MGHFKHTWRPARFFFMDFRVGLIFVVSLMHLRFYTIAIDVIAVALAWYVERLGMTLPGAIRALRAWVAGPYRPALPPNKMRQRTDFEYVRLAWQPERVTGEFHLKEIVFDGEQDAKFKSSKAATVKARKQ